MSIAFYSFNKMRYWGFFERAKAQIVTVDSIIYPINTTHRLNWFNILFDYPLPIRITVQVFFA